MANFKPKGNNDLNSKYTYVQRLQYERYANAMKEVYPNLVLINLRKKNLYGKIDLDNAIAVPDLQKMIAFDGVVNTFDFVGDALKDLSDKIKKRITNGSMQSGGPYGVLRFSERADKNWKREYVDYLGTIQKRFLQEKLNSATKFDDVVDFRNFLVTFLDFAAEINPAFPLSFGRYAVSLHNDIFTTGLAFDLNDEEYGNDYISCSKYFEDPNFQTFFQEAQNHGFILDRHAPWRFVANLTSTPMKEYMKARGYYNMKDMFRQLYFNPLVAEFFEIVKMINVMYTDVFPVGSKYTEICYKSGKTSHTLKERVVFDPSLYANLPELISALGYPFWLRVYSFIKGMEVNSTASQKEFDDIVEEAVELNKYLDTEDALMYINSKFDPLKVSNSQKSPTFKF